MLRLSQLKLNIEQPIEDLRDLIIKRLNINESELINYYIYKESIDARKVNEIYFVYTVDITIKNESRFISKKIKDLTITPELNYIYPTKGDIKLNNKVVVVGFGPAGMFAALILAEMGYKPVVFERGGDVDSRVKAVEAFWKDGLLDVNNNVQFGEGGAGTFSDGKLTTRVKDLRGRKVLEVLVEAGAPESILYEAHPHVGTDLLRDIVKNIRIKIIELGGEIHFNTEVTDFLIEDNKINALEINNSNYINTDAVILAIGHSARNTFEQLYARKVMMHSKPFAVGARIEHPQILINKAQFKEFYNHPRLGAAEYRLTHTASNGRGVYTFCMCPGGLVVPSSSEENRVVTNGMSEYARDAKNANSAILVQVGPEDFGDNPLDGIKFQRELETKAFKLGGRNYQAPAQLVKDFLNNRPSSKLGSVVPSYALGVKPTDLHDLFPNYITDALKEGIIAFDRKLKGFGFDDAIITAVESRSSSPIRIDRDQNSCESLNIIGLYPSGEGAGYAGGIVSAGIDGILCAEAIIHKYIN